MDAKQFLLDHPWICRVGHEYLLKQKSEATIVAEAEEARAVANLEQLEAETAEKMLISAEASLAAAKENGRVDAIAAAQQLLSDAKAAVKRERQEAELAGAVAATKQATIQAQVEQAEAYIEEKEAQDAEMAVIRAQAMLEGAPSEYPLERTMSEQQLLVEALDQAKVDAVRARNEADVAEADAELARSLLDADETAACALKENLELLAAEQMVIHAEAALTTALDQQDEAACSQARLDLASAKAALEKEQGEAQVADAVASVARAEVVADKAATRALEGELQAQAADELLKQMEAAFAASQLEANVAAIDKATKALNEARTAAKKERSNAQAAASKAAEAEALAAAETEVAMEVMDQVEARAAENAGVSIAENKYLRWYSIGAGFLLVFTVFFVGLGAWFGIYILANRVIDNDKMMVPADTCLQSSDEVLCGRWSVKVKISCSLHQARLYKI